LFVLKEIEVRAEVGEDRNRGMRGRRRDERYVDDTKK
jgi:hypothetical protein